MSQKQAQLLASAIGGGGLPSVIGADNTLLTSTGAVAQWETLSSLIDAVFGSTRGMMLRRGASTWEAFAKGTQYQALTGGATDPTWAAIDISQASAITGTLGIGNGGTGQTTANPAFNALAPTTTRGDLIRRGASVNERVALGATGTILGSDGADPIWRTLTALLDAVIGSSQGTILKRGASSWEALAKGTSTYVLTAGASDISWAAPAGWTLIDSGSLPSANAKTFTSITARQLLLKVNGASCGTATRYLKLQLSTNNGSTYSASAGYYVAAGTAADAPDSTSFLPTTTTQGTAGVSSFAVQITTQGGICVGDFSGTSVTTPRVFTIALAGVPSSAVDAMRVIWNSTGSFDAGTYELYGI